MTLKKVVRVVMKLMLAQVLMLSTGLVYLAEASYIVSAIDFSQNETGYQLSVKGENPPTYTIYELFDPQRVVLDIADGSFDSKLNFPIELNQGPVSKILGKVLDDKEPTIAKVEIFLIKDLVYAVERQGNNVLINFTKEKEIINKPVVDKSVNEEVSPSENIKEDINLATNTMPIEDIQESSAEAKQQDIVADLLESISKPNEGALDKQLKRAGVETDEFAAAGFKKQKISVDFYKIDLHNVFRLFGEISGSNLIIDQGVSGTITLALNEVPWDFAMDIILNLKGLEKEERFNTIVISKKKFEWPEEPEKALDIRAPQTDVKIAIEQRLEMPVGMLEAKKLMHRATIVEKEGNNSKALELYEEALSKWPENADLARRISSFCLVELGLNAKALHYAKVALSLDSDDNQAALNAAIAAANMRNSEADGYFKMATSGDRPEQEALVSYASYSEQKGAYVEALGSLNRHGEIYGDSLETMIARARIYDKNGKNDKAIAEYQTILYSGYELDADLKRFIKGRVGQVK